MKKKYGYELSAIKNGAESDQDKILAHFLAGKSLTTKEGREISYSFTPLICRLRKDGHNIKDKQVIQNGRRVKKYYM